MSVLERKRWTRRQVGAWLLGAVVATALTLWIALNLAGPEKRIQRLPQFDHGVEDPQFRREMSVMLGPSIVAGNQVEDLHNGDEIFPAMLAAIASARRSITFETYIYWSGDVGRRFSQALAERARAGVAVHLTIDWLGSVKMDPALLQAMRRAGVQVERYRPLDWYSWDRVNNRTHRKLLVVDGAVAFTGGVGIADQWLGHAQDPGHWREAHFRLRGPAVSQFQAAFNDNWLKMTGRALTGPAYFPALAPAGPMDAQLFVSSPTSGSESMHLMYLMALAGARRSIDLSASYFVPDELIARSLLRARQRGVRVRILVPGEHTDSQTVRLASRAQWGPLLAAGVEFHEYRPTMMHVKMLIVDEYLVSVGSTNVDIRSFRLNDEASLNVYDRRFAARMRGVFERDLADARRYTLRDWQRRAWHERLREALLRPIRSQL